MMIELKTQWGTDMHQMNNEQLKKFSEWYENKHSIKVFTYYRNGYSWCINKSQVESVKFLKE